MDSGNKAFMYAVRLYPHNTQIIANFKFSLDQANAKSKVYRQNVQKLNVVISFVSDINNQDTDRLLHGIKTPYIK